MAGIAANLIAAAHIGYFLFIVGGSVGLAIGAAKRWKWIRNPWFRFSHLLAVYVVIIEDVINFAPCPLNTMEWQLRSGSGSIEASSGVGGLLDRLLFHTVPGRVLDLIYWSLAVLLLVALFVVPPKFRHHVKRAGDSAE